LRRSSANAQELPNGGGTFSQFKISLSPPLSERFPALQFSSHQLRDIFESHHLFGFQKWIDFYELMGCCEGNEGVI
jgi:hypothetical protein